MARAMVCHRPERVPSASPDRVPATETSVHGNPATRTQTGSTVLKSTWVISPRLGTPGQWCSRMAAAPGAGSACQAIWPPRTDCTPRSRPP
ncbi:hypothetical protein HS99_0009780 [Kitasatospora aureofaciens]|uniref:Uncharacterized protein n=1 Tax=Kitasatospora aureofaciens TaxID=1894 RepID=A0A1E7N228_KITAU|nr:hypothetical protein HS99_0009780 [Kitasatospora aureofaciens]